jgi:hypothetical protein
VKKYKLLPCPFCDFQDYTVSSVRYGTKFIAIYCPNCDARGTKVSIKNGGIPTAIMGWNTRAPIKVKKG